MNARITALVLACILFTSAGHGAAQAPRPTFDEGEVIHLDTAGTGELSNFVRHGRRDALRRLQASREQFPNGIAHYHIDVRVGRGEYDVVRLHRVVRERKPHRPVRTDSAVFMAHGANLNFESIFLRAGAVDPGSADSIALNFAANGIDVWGIDFGWTQVPDDTTDFAFMQNWGVERDAKHTLKAMSLARVLRGLTGQGFGRMILLGYSYGVAVIYAAAGRETQQPRFWRNIKGLIPVDGAMKYSGPDEASRLEACADKHDIAAAIAAGVYQDSGGLTAGLLSSLATSAPQESSPIFPGLTNFQAPLLFGAKTYMILRQRAPFWHFVAGTDDPSGQPEGLLYADTDRWIRFLGNLSAHMPNLARFESAATICDEDSLRIDDFLTQISVPIFYLGAGGAFGDFGNYTSTLTSSSDITNLTVRLQPDELRAIDYGHADLFLATNANVEAWDALRAWLATH